MRDGALVDAAKIGGVAQRLLVATSVARLFDIEIDRGRFLYHYDEGAFAYEELLAGRYVLLTSLTQAQASTAQVFLALPAARRDRTPLPHPQGILKDFLHLRPVRHWTERRVRGHIAVCVYAAAIEALMASDDVRDPDLGDQHLSTARTLRKLGRVRTVALDADAVVSYGDVSILTWSLSTDRFFRMLRLRVAVSTPCMTASTEMTCCGRSGNGSKPIVALPGSIR